ncbi:MAG: hypothetical protein ACP5Q0_02920 [Halothiobacillus sp.]
MAKKTLELLEAHCAFIQCQPIYFVGTATEQSRVNVSPKGLDTLRILSPTRIVWPKEPLIKSPVDRVAEPKGAEQGREAAGRSYSTMPRPITPLCAFWLSHPQGRAFCGRSAVLRRLRREWPFTARCGLRLIPQNPVSATWDLIRGSLTLTGSGNESAAHVALNPRMTLMFCSFEQAPLILRTYGQARVVHPRDAAWAQLYALFPNHPGARQLFDLNINLVQTSCGFGVPEFAQTSTTLHDRPTLNRWAEKKGVAGIAAYWQEKNTVTMDNLPTHILSTDDTD